MLSNMSYPDFPVALGIIRAVTANTYNDNVVNQIEHVQKTAKFKTIKDLLYSGNTWEVKG
jgi:2-oxoglutarate ferredoxin oxidoreductase subunit beta